MNEKNYGKKRTRQEFVQLVQRFRSSKDKREAMRLGDEVGRMIFGGGVNRFKPSSAGASPLGAQSP